MNNTKKNLIGSLLIYIIVFGPTTYILIEWYVSPVLDGMTIALDYFRDKDQAFVLEMTNFNATVQEYKPIFTEKFMNVTSDESLSVDESVDILQDDLDALAEEEIIKAYKVILFLFAPIITMPAVVYLHVRYWLWVSNLVMRLFKIDPDFNNKKSDEHKELKSSIYKVFKDEEGETKKIVTVTKDGLFKEYNLKEFKDK